MAALDPNTPAMMPPPGVIPNFHGESRAASLLATCIPVTVLMVAFVVLRFLSRKWYLKSFSYDDYSCAAAALGSIGLTVTIVLSTTAGLGRHQWNYPISIFTKSYWQKIVAWEGIYPPILLAAKLSLFFLYFRIFSKIPRTKILLCFGIGLIVVAYTTSFFLVLYFCGPLSGSSFAETITSHHCAVDSQNLGIFLASFNIFTDLYLLSIPIPIVLNLQLSGKRKTGICAMFMTGSLAVICSILNLYYRILALHTQDFTWAGLPVYITSVFEINICITCSCFPALPPIFRSVRSFLSSNKSPSETRVNSPRYFKWSPFKNSDSILNSRIARVTLGSRIKGDGHFLTGKSMIAREDERTGSMDISLQGHEHSMQTHIRSSYSQDPERGSQTDGIRVETEMTLA